MFRPNLAATVDFNLLRFPVLASQKLDGFRMTIHGGVGMSRTMKPLPNRALQRWVQAHATLLQSLDGEVVVGPPNASDVFQRTTSELRREDGEPDFTYLVFDHINRVAPYAERLKMLDGLDSHRVRKLHHTLLPDLAHLEEYERACLEQGYEGVVLRNPSAFYKQGRSTVREAGMLKLKRYEDAEAVILSVEELMHNDNPEFRSETGYAKHSTQAVGLFPGGTMGALLVKGLNGQFVGKTFSIGTGFTAQQRLRFWNLRATAPGHILTYKFFPMGSLVSPRHPVFKALRPGWDQDPTV